MNGDAIFQWLARLKQMVTLSPSAAGWMANFLIQYYYGILTLLFLCTVAALLLSWRSFRDLITKTSKGALIGLVLIFISSAIIRFFVLSHNPQVFCDEALFYETARGFYHYGLNVRYHEGALNSLLFICPNGWAYLIFLAIRFLGIERIAVAFGLSAFLSSITVFFMFYLVKLLFDNEKAALWSAAIFTLAPVFMRISTSSAMETSSTFFLVLTLFLFVFYLRERQVTLLYLSFFSLAFLGNMRQENFMVLVPVILVFFFLFHPAVKEEFKRPHIYVCLPLLLFFVFPAIAASVYGVSVNYYYFFEPMDQMRQHIVTNSQLNIIYWIQNAIQPLSLTIMAIVGLYLVFLRDRPLAIFLMLWFGLMQVFYSINPSCEFACQRTLDSWRSVSNQVTLLVILAGLTPVAILEYFKLHYPKAQKWVLFLLILVVLMIPFRFANFIDFKTVWCQEYRYVGKFSRSIDPSSVIIVDRGNRKSLDAFAALLSYESVVPILSYNLMDPNKPWSERPLFRDVFRYKFKEKRPLYFCFLAANTSNFSFRMKFYNDTFNLRMVGGYADSESKSGLIIYEVMGLKDM